MKNFPRRSLRSSTADRRTRPALTKRRLLGEMLEGRQLLAGDVVEVMPHHNYWAPADVNEDARISPLDALVVINDLNRSGARSLDDAAVTGSNYVDVNNDGLLSPSDALNVVNTLNRGTPEALDELIELQVGLTDLQGNSLLDAGSRTAQVSPGEFFKIELLYKDLRSSLQSPRGLAQAYVDFLVSQPSAIEPVLTETQIADFSFNIVEASGFMTIGIEGSSETVDITASQFNADAVGSTASAIQQLLDLDNPPTVTVQPFTGQTNAPDIVRVKVRFEGPEFYNVDVPNLTVDTSNLQAPDGPVTADLRIIPAVNPDGSLNGDAVAQNLDLLSRTNGERVYVQAVNGTYNEVAEPATPESPAVEAGFNEVGGFTSNFGINNYAEPFHAFSILARAVEPATGVVIQVDTPDTENQNLQIQGVNQTVPDNRVLIDTDDSAAIEGDDRPGLVVLNIVAGVTANPDTLTVQEDASGSVNVLANDVNQITGPLSILSLGNPANGTVSFSGGTVTYTPDANFFGSDSFTYVAQNADGDTGIGTVNVTITSVNDAPVFNTDPVRNGTEDTQLTIDTSALLSNDLVGPANETNQSLSVTAVAAASASGGTATLNNGTITYTPRANFNGNDTLTYTISDGAGGTTTGTVTIAVAPVNDAPVLALDSVSVNEDTTLTVNQSAVLGSSRPGPATATDEASQTLLITAAGTNGLSSEGGTVSVDANGQITYIPADDFFGTDTFPITVTDSGGETATGTVTVTVNPVNDAPIAEDDVRVVDELSTGNVLNVLLNDSAGPGEDTTQSITGITLRSTAGANGQVSLSQDGRSVVYTPNSNFIGQASFTYTITDSEGAVSDEATVTLNVVPVLRPRAIDDNVVVPEDSGSTTIPILANDLANENHTVTLQTVDSIPAGQGTLVENANGTVTFTPAPNFNGQVTFTYTISDTSNPNIDQADEIEAATGTVTISVTPVNDAPIFTPDAPRSAVEDTLLTIPAGNLLANDSPGPANESSQTLSVTAVSSTSAQGGSVSLDGQTIRYNPAANFNGTDTFTYTISDSAGGTVTGTATVSVAAVNDPPVLDLNTVTVAEDTTQTVQPSTLLGSSTPGPAGATDEASQTLQVTAVGTNGQTAQGGTVSVDANGRVTYTPPVDFFGTDTFPITVTDSAGASTTGTVTVDVTPVNDPPVLNDPPLIAFSSGTATFTRAQLVAASVAGPANEANQTLTVTGATAVGATTGTVVYNNDGTVTYTPAPDFIGQDTFQLTISDGSLTDTELVTVDVQEFQPSVISGAVFFDYIESLENQVRDGIQGDHEPGLQMAEVRLVSDADSNVTGAPIDMTLSTDLDGQFQFNNVPPGTYRLVFEVPEMVYDGADFAGTAGDSDSVQNQFTINIPEPGGVDATGYNFTLYGTSGRAGNALDMLVSSFLRSQNGSTTTSSTSSTSSGGLAGATAVVDADGNTEWFKGGAGFEGVRYGEININAAATNVSLTVVMEDGTVLTGMVPSDRFVFLRDASGSTVVQIFGDLSSFNLVPDGMLDVSEAGLLNYQSAVDQLLSQSDSVI